MMTTGNQMKISSFNCMILKPIKNLLDKTLKLESQLLMMISQVKFASKTQKASRLLLLMSFVILLLLERMEVMEKYQLITKLFN